MEMLSSIWSALSTENEFLTNIIVNIFSFIEAILSLYLFTSILDFTVNKIKKIYYVILASLISILGMYLIPSPFNTFVNFVLIFLLIKIIFKENLLNTLIATFLPSIIFALIVTFISNPFIHIFNINYDTLTSIPIYRFLLLLCIYAITLIFIFLIRYKNTNLDNLELLSKSNKLILLANLTFGSIILFAQGCLIYFYLDKLPVLYTMLSFISLLSYFGISIYSLTKVIKLEDTTLKLENAEQYNNTLQILHDNVRCFKHDFDNIVTTIGGYIATDDMDGLKTYYSQLECDCKKVNNAYILNPKIVNNPGVYSLIVTKYKKADELGIKMNIEFLLDLNDVEIDIYHLTRTLGILLDNAIEAAEESKEKLVNVYFRDEGKNNRKLVIVENSYSNKDVNTEEIFIKGKSGKENHTGLGLFEVRKILSKSSNLNLHTSKTTDLFKQQLEIYSF